MDQQNRFAGIIGQEYGLIKKVIPHYEELQEKLATVVNDKVSLDKRGYGSAIEIGCGSAYTTSAVLAKNTGLFVFAVDNDLEMIKQARRNLNSNEMASFHKVDALTYLKRRPNDSLDLVFSALTLHNFDLVYRLQVLDQIYRTLKWNGLFVNADKYAVGNKRQHARNLRWQLDRFDLFEEMGRTDLKNGWTDHYLEDEEPRFLMGEDEAIADMKRLGFANINIHYRKGMEAILSAVK